MFWSAILLVFMIGPLWGNVSSLKDLKDLEISLNDVLAEIEEEASQIEELEESNSS